MKILLIGADGQLGTDLVKTLKNEDLNALTLSDLDITNKAAVVSVLSSFQPEIVINTAAYNRTEDAEEQIEAAFAINSIGVKYLAEVCRSLDSTLVHISTDYVFLGDKRTPYAEDDVPAPQSVYAISKLAGEQCVRYLLKKYFIIRTSGLYGVAGCMSKGGGNFVEGRISDAKAGKSMRIIDDEISAPTYTLDVAKIISQLIRTPNYGLYHVTNSGECSWYQFTKKIMELLSIEAEVVPISTTAFKSKIIRPRYSVLSHHNLKKIGLNNLRSWEEALEAYLKEKGYL